MRRLAILPLLACLPIAACGLDTDENVVDHHEHAAVEEENIGSTSSALVPTDPVSTSIAQSCSTAPARPLVDQLIAELECLRPGTMKRIDKLPGIQINGAGTLPFLQTAAANALIKAQKARGVTIAINSGLRTIVEQYMLNRLFQRGCAGIFQPAPPGQSNHETGTAIDIQDNAAWRGALSNNGWVWLGAFDPVHYDYKGGGTVALVGLGVTSFQRLWNRNNPTDKIAEDGSFGPQTEARILKSPIGGFKQGALPNCGVVPDAGADAAADAEAPVGTEAGTPDQPGTPPGGDPSAEPSTTDPSTAPEAAEAEAAEEGCSVSTAPRHASIAFPAFALLGFAALLRPALRRRRRQD